jgi:phosphotransferase system enzyme I (PtsP)
MPDQSRRISVIATLSRIIAESPEPRTSLQQTVRLLAETFSIDVCSIYLLERDRQQLTLMATIGLNQDSIGAISMRIDEGLTGLVLERREPLFVSDPASHPRFKLFAESGEERYTTYLGLPLIYHQDLLGVLVLQTVSPSGISQRDIEFFSAVAAQISALAAYTGLIDELEREREASRDPVPAGSETRPIRKRPRTLVRGIAAAPGFAFGTAHFLEGSLGFEEIEPIPAGDRSHESERFQEALREGQEEMRQLTERLASVPEADLAVLQVQQSLLEDAALERRVRTTIEEGWTAEYALKEAVSHYLGLLSRTEDPYLRERGKDIEDAGKAILAHLIGPGSTTSAELAADSVVIASDVSPAELVQLRQKHLQALVLTRGGLTSHTVILAKSFRIPAVIKAADVLDSVHEGDSLIVDGTSGLVYPRPSEEIAAEYRRLQQEREQLEERLARNTASRARTRDGELVRVGANIGLLSDFDLVTTYGADHIGLYRTEFPFLARRSFPSEEEQTELYSQIAERAGGMEVTVRTLDVGGDKFLPYLEAPKEDNPYLGWRSIRLTLELDSILRSQLRAILRASLKGRLKILFPMITTAAEVSTLLTLLDEVKRSLDRDGLGYDPSIPVGIMLEVPGAVGILDSVLPRLDFVSIGTNDLIQYLLAADRNNPKVALLSNPLHPGVLGTIATILDLCSRHGTPASICGEAAANPASAALFLAMGARELSLNPASIPLIKDFIASLDLAHCRQCLDKARHMEGAEEIDTYLQRELQLP